VDHEDLPRSFTQSAYTFVDSARQAVSAHLSELRPGNIDALSVCVSGGNMKPLHKMTGKDAKFSQKRSPVNPAQKRELKAAKSAARHVLERELAESLSAVEVVALT
jgi:hypothetical protein